MADPAAGAQAADLLDHGGEQIVGMEIALHHRAGLAGQHQRDGALGGDAMVGFRQDAQLRNVGVQFLGGLGDSRGIADQDRLDQPLGSRQKRAAERIMVFRTHHHGLEPGQLRRQRDQMRKVILLLHDQHRQFAR